MGWLTALVATPTDPKRRCRRLTVISFYNPTRKETNYPWKLDSDIRERPLARSKCDALSLSLSLSIFKFDHLATGRRAGA